MPRSRKPNRSYVWFTQQRMSPRGYTTLPERFKDRESWVKFCLIDSKQNPILSGKACQALKSRPARQRPQGALRPTPWSRECTWTIQSNVNTTRYPIPSADEIVAKIPDATVFTVLDAKSEYLQLKLDFESSLLKTMNTPTERYRWVLNQPWKCTKEPWMKC